MTSPQPPTSNQPANRLLAMLNSATSPSPSSTSSNNPFNNLTSTNNPSPREPTPTPPNYQSISLQDLFKSIAPSPLPTPGFPTEATGQGQGQGQGQGMKATTSAPAVAVQTVTGTGGGEDPHDQQNRLLGMLRNIGVTPLIQPQPQSRVEDKEEKEEKKKINGSEGQKVQTESDAHAQVSELLAGLKKSSSAIANQAAQLTTGSPAPPEVPVPQVKGDSQPAPTKAPAPVFEFTGSSKSSSPAPSATKSMFHFISPFDAFTAPPASPSKPKSSMGPVPTSTLGKRAGSTLEKPDASSISPQVPVEVPATKEKEAITTEKREDVDVKPTKEELKAVDAAVEAPTQSAKKVVEKNGSGDKEDVKAKTATPAKGKKANGKAAKKESAGTPVQLKTAPPVAEKRVKAETVVPVALAAKKTPKAVQSEKGKGLDLTSQTAIVDADNVNPAALVTQAGAVQLHPVTAMKRAPVKTLPNGRIVGLTRGWIAYALEGGRMRLLDRETGARLVLQLPVSASSGTILDIAVSPTRIAALAADHSITVYEVPTSWSHDDPNCLRALHILGGSGDDSDIGQPKQIEWVDRGDMIMLAVGGSKGVVMFNPRDVGNTAKQRTISMKDVIRPYVIYKTILEADEFNDEDDELVGFCFNSSQAAMALISNCRRLTLYSVASSKRVFHRQIELSQSESSTIPSSIQFCESNILIGRNGNTILDLVQISGNISVIGTIQLSSTGSHSAIYDDTNSVLWLTAPGQIFGFQYALKGQPPIKSGEICVPWAKEVAVGIEDIISMVIAKPPGVKGYGMDFVYAHNKGVSLGSIGQEVIRILGSPAVEKPEEVESVEEEEKEKEVVVVDEEETDEDTTVDEAGDENIHPSAPQHEEVEEVEVKAEPKSTEVESIPEAVPAPETSAPVANSETSTSQQSRSIARPPAEEESDDEPVIVEKTSNKAIGEENIRQMKKMEDRIVTQFRQALSAQINGVNGRIDTIGGEKMISEIALKVEEGMKGYMGELVKDEVRSSILPSFTSAIQSEITTIVPGLVSTGLNDNLRQIVPKELERILVPVVQQAVTKVLQSTVDKAVQETMKRVVTPALTQSMGKMFEGLAMELKAEMSQMRKEIAQPQPGLVNTLQATTTSIEDLKSMIAALSTQVASNAASTAALQSQLITQKSPPPSAPIASKPPPTRQLPQTQSQNLPPGIEDVFLSALSKLSTPDTLNLLNAYWGMTDYCLPLNPNPLNPSTMSPKPPLSQAVMLTLFHRLAIVLNELPPNDGMFQKALNWERRVAGLLDPRVPETGDFYGRVVSVVRETLGGVVQRLGGGGGQGEVGRALREIVEIVSQKQ